MELLAVWSFTQKRIIQVLSLARVNQPGPNNKLYIYFVLFVLNKFIEETFGKIVVACSSCNKANAMVANH